MIMRIFFLYRHQYRKGTFTTTTQCSHVRIYVVVAMETMLTIVFMKETPNGLICQLLIKV